MAIAWIRAIAFALAGVPFAWLVFDAFTGGLGVNPIEAITRTTGRWTLIMLLVTLAVTPLRRMLNLPWLLRLRRMLGLFAFFYGCLHLATYLVFDQFFDWMAIGEDIVKRPFITVGFAAWAMMVPLAITSTNAMVRRLGARNWQRLHYLVYAVGICGVTHYWWLVKADVSDPLNYAAVLAGLLAYRVGIRLAGRR